ncbi:MAG: flagellar filament capping protein FliD [Ignavibacteria bacterium]|nr:flagellar filament capping protein FliD [Ignavibacteria bacterium]
MADYLTTSGINSLVQSYSSNEVNKRITPLQNKKKQYENLSSAWTTLQTRLGSLKTISDDLQKISSGAFTSKLSDSSNSSFVSATSTSTAADGTYAIRVSQLAKGDLLVSNTMSSDTAVTNMAGTHTFHMVSGEYYADVSVDLTDSETNKTIMQKISDAIVTDKAVSSSAKVSSTGTFTGAGSFQVDLNGTKTSINYDYSSGANYGDVISDIASKINSSISGVTAEKIVDGGNVSLKLTAKDASQYLSFDGLTGNLFDSSNLNLSVTKQKGGAGIASSAVFAPSSGNSKLSLTAVNTGYDYRLQMSDTSGSALSFVGWDSNLLTNRTMAPSDNTAGFMYNINSSTDNQLNAKFTLNGINIQSNSNTVDTAISGVTLNLKATMGTNDSTASIYVHSDVETVKNKIKDFTKKFNDVYTYIKQRYTSGEDGRGLFVGDASASSLMNTMKNIAISQVSGIPQGNIDYLSKIGITFDTDNGLVVSDDSKLSSQLANFPAQVADMFTSTKGIATQMYTAVSRFTGSDGVISKLLNTYGNNIKYMADKITSTQSSIDKSAEVLRAQYQTLQTQMATLLTNSQFFSGTSSQGLFG